MMSPSSRSRITYEQLVAYAAETLPAAQRAAIEAHLAANPQDAATVTWYRTARLTLASDDSVEPPAGTIAKAKAAFRQKAGAPAGIGWLDAVEQFIGRLIFDSRVDAVAVRSANVSQRINLTFESETGAEIDLQAEPIRDSSESERWRVMGQVSDAEAAGRRVAISTSGSKSVVVETKTDEHGGFSMDVESGRYDLYVELPRGVVVMRDVEIA